MTLPVLYTIGHSTHAGEEFRNLLTRHGIGCLVDVRRFPGSRKFPQFNQEPLEASLREVGIVYRWMVGLGGRRKSAGKGPSLNEGLRNESFRNYADYMLTEQFRSALEPLLEIAATTPTAIMCSESLFWRCHRRLISDYLVSRGGTVIHIMPDGKTQPHSLTAGAKVADGVLTYPSEPADVERRLFE